MDISSLEQVFRSAMGANQNQLALATMGGGVDLPSEFVAAAKSLEERADRTPKAKSILSVVTEAWF